MPGQIVAPGGVPPPQQAVLVQSQVSGYRLLPHHRPPPHPPLPHHPTSLPPGAPDCHHAGRSASPGTEANAGRETVPADQEDVPRPARKIGKSRSRYLFRCSARSSLFCRFSVDQCMYWGRLLNWPLGLLIWSKCLLSVVHLQSLNFSYFWQPGKWNLPQLSQLTS